MTIKHVLVLFFVVISNICHAGMEQDLEDIKKSMESANQKIAETKNKLNTPKLFMSGPLGASEGFEFRLCGFSQDHPEAVTAFHEALTYTTQTLRQIKFFTENYREFEQVEALSNLHSSVQDQLERVSLESEVVLSLPLASEIASQLQKIEELAKKINAELSRI